MPAVVDKAEKAMQDARVAAVTARNAYETVKAEVLAAPEYPAAGTELHNKLKASAEAISLTDQAATDAANFYMAQCAAEGVAARAGVGEGPDGAPAPTPGGGDAASSIMAGANYAHLRETLMRSGSMGVGGVKPLGEAASREGFRNALVTGGSSSSGGAFTTSDFQPYVDIPGRPQSILDWITIGTTDSDTVEYPRLVTRTDSAAFAPEATTVVASSEDGLKPEGSAAFEVVTANVKTLAVLVPVTRQAFSDAGQLRTILNTLMTDDLRRKQEAAIYTNATNGYTGILNTTGINTVAYSASYDLAQQIRRGITQIRLDFEEPDYIAMNPADAEKLAFQRAQVYNGTTTAQGGDYLYGSPQQGSIPTLWGKPVIESALITEGRVLIGTRNAATLWVREGVQTFVSDSHKDWFQRNVLALLAESRAAFGVQRPNAFADVDIAASS